MPAKHRVNIVAPNFQKKRELKREAGKRGMNVSKFFWHCFDSITKHDYDAK